MIDHRENMKAYITTAEEHVENPLIAEKLGEFWKAYDKLAAVVKLVDNGELDRAMENQLSDVERYLKSWKSHFSNPMKPNPYRISTKLVYDDPNWEDEEFRGK